MVTENETKQAPVSFAQLSKLIYNDLEKSVTKSSVVRKYDREAIIRFLETPHKSQKQLRELSRILYNNSPHYRRLIQHFATMLRFDHVIEPYDLNIEKVEIDKFKKQYDKTAKLIDIMNLPHEMQKVLKICFKEDVFYGYEYSTEDSYFIQRLNPDYCRISSLEDGIYNFEYDFAFFDATENDINFYPKEFQRKYQIYQSSKVKKRWQELDGKNTICIKVNDELEYPLPPFNTIFESLYDIEDTKKISKINAKMDNYMILTQHIPIDEKNSEADKFLINLDTAISFHNKAVESLPDEVGLVTSPMKIEAIKLERKNNEADYVAKAEKEFYDASGVSQQLFNGDNKSSASLNKSIISDEQIAFAVLRQIERWVNRKLKYQNTKYKFKVKLLNTTAYNYQEVQSTYLNAAQYGIPVIQELAATMGITPAALNAKIYLQNDVFKMHEKLIPLASSHTQSNKDGAGAPEVDENELSDEGQKTRDNDSNDR